MVSESVKNKQRATTVLALALFATIFVLINAQQFLIAAVLYIVIGMMSIFLYNQWGNIGKRVGDLEGIDSNFIQDFFVGVGLGVGTIFLGTIIPGIGALGLPNVQSIAGTIGRFIIIVISAPVFEEIFFRDFMLNFFDEKLEMPFFISNFITAIAFSLYHLAAYGENLAAAGGSFFTAALMGFIFGYVRLKQESVIGSIGYHLTLNLWIGVLSLAIII